MKKILITGITGQDGAHLANFLLDKGCEVFGTYRRISNPNFWRLQYLGIFDKIKLIPVDLIDSASIVEAVKVSEPDEIYHLAAQSYVGAAFEQPLSTGEITGLGTCRVLEAIRNLNPDIKMYNAASSEIYGNGYSEPLNEDTPFKPSSPYAVAKLYGFWTTNIYRKAYNMFACNGILFNHEGPLRGMEFVTRKISNSVARIALGLQDKLVLGNLEAKRDWGLAENFIEAMYLMLQQDEPDDYVIATNESHSIREFVEIAFSEVGLDWQKHVETDKRFYRPLDVSYLQGDYTKAKNELGWEPKVKFNELVKIMVASDLNNWKRWLNGEHFNWDAPAYPNESNILTRSYRGNNNGKQKCGV